MGESVKISRDWTALRDRLATLEVAKCRLAHERVAQRDGLVIWQSRGESERLVVRRGLCNWEIRRQQLSCAHTTARYLLQDALTALHRAGEMSEETRASLHGQVTAIADTIHGLDTRKYDAEKLMALAAERMVLNARENQVADPQLATDVAAAEAAVAALEQEHGECVERLLALRSRILELLDAIIVRGA
jgi:hypothetical protein